MHYIISEYVEVKIRGGWWGAEILDISGDYAYIHIFDLNIKKNVKLTELR